MMARHWARVQLRRQLVPLDSFNPKIETRGQMDKGAR